MALEAAGTVGETEPCARGNHRHVCAVMAKVRHEGYDPGLAKLGQAGGEREVGMGHNSQVDASKGGLSST